MEESKKADDPGMLVRHSASFPPVHDSAVETVKAFEIALILTCSSIRVIFTLLYLKFCIYGYSKLIYNSC